MANNAKPLRLVKAANACEDSQSSMCSVSYVLYICYVCGFHLTHWTCIEKSNVSDHCMCIGILYKQVDILISKNQALQI